MDSSIRSNRTRHKRSNKSFQIKSCNKTIAKSKLIPQLPLWTYVIGIFVCHWNLIKEEDEEILKKVIHFLTAESRYLDLLTSFQYNSLPPPRYVQWCSHAQECQLRYWGKSNLISLSKTPGVLKTCSILSEIRDLLCFPSSGIQRGWIPHNKKTRAARAARFPLGYCCWTSLFLREKSPINMTGCHAIRAGRVKATVLRGPTCRGIVLHRQILPKHIVFKCPFVTD